MENTEILKAQGMASDIPGHKSQPDSLETHLVRKSGYIVHQRALSPWIYGCMDGFDDPCFA